VIDNKDANKPSLRRASTSNSTGNGDGTTSSDGDDKPTLKRRDDSGSNN
jgi:hypothetical protein